MMKFCEDGEDGQVAVAGSIRYSDLGIRLLKVEEEAKNQEPRTKGRKSTAETIASTAS